MTKGKKTDGLMRHLRDNKNMDIQGSKQKRELLQMGYYHGYKGYRFIKQKNNPILFTEFDQLKSIYDFDMHLKSLLYPYIMSIETALKNYTIDTLVSYGSLDLEFAFKNFLLDYKSETVGSSKYNLKMKDRLTLRKKIDTEISFKFSKNEIVTHFLRGDSMPLWAVFEILDMGSFGLFLKCLNEPIRIDNCNDLKLTHTSIVNDGNLVRDVIFTLKELRNSVAHNNVIFDCRFSGNTSAMNSVKAYVMVEVGVSNIEFNFLIDYFILIVLLLKKLGYNKTELKKIIKQFKDETEQLRLSVPISICNRINGTDLNAKINCLNNYI
ncbi:Abi family protein [Bacillus safensis]|uniref:Abi family protein n=1 Tax=Bacillus safensis TaxID=561879 RepID=UPI002E2E0CFC|nr:Abi family protein [Bacillus safensis]MED5224135.1 Abi family protein [Bacillus safensis]